MTNILNKYDEITNNKFIIALMMCVFIVPSGIINIAYSYLPMLKIRVLFGIMIAIKLFIKLKKDKKFPIMLALGIIYCFGRFLITYIDTKVFKTSLLDYSALITLPLVMLVESNIDDNAKNFIQGVLIYIETVILLNIFCILIPSFGAIFYEHSTLGPDNYHFANFCIALPIAYINYYINKNKFTFYNMMVLYIVIVFFSLKYWCATNIVAVFVFFITLLISKFTKIANIITYIGTYLVSFIGIVLFNAQYLFSFLIVDVLHKSLTLSLREYLWRDFKIEIVKKPIFGHGYHNQNLYSPEQHKYLHAHNHILQELYCGGVVMYLIYIWFVILPAKKLWENRDNEVSKVLSSTLLAILIHCLCESISVSLFIFIFTIVYHVEKYIELERSNCHE